MVQCPSLYPEMPDPGTASDAEWEGSMAAEEAKLPDAEIDIRDLDPVNGTNTNPRTMGHVDLPLGGGLGRLARTGAKAGSRSLIRKAAPPRLNLVTAVGDKLATRVKNVLKGKGPLKGLSLRVRRRAAAHYHRVANKTLDELATLVKEGKGSCARAKVLRKAARYNRWRAAYLEGTTKVPPPPKIVEMR